MFSSKYWVLSCFIFKLTHFQIFKLIHCYIRNFSILHKQRQLQKRSKWRLFRTTFVLAETALPWALFFDPNRTQNPRKGWQKESVHSRGMHWQNPSVKYRVWLFANHNPNISTLWSGTKGILGKTTTRGGWAANKEIKNLQMRVKQKYKKLFSIINCN